MEEFPRRDRRLRLSRAWCRGLIVAEPRSWPTALTREFGVPSAVDPRDHPGGRGAGRAGQAGRRGPGRVPVVGAAGPLVAGSGFATFLNAARKVVDAGLDAEFLIAGQGEDEGDLRRRAERLRIAERLTFADDLPVGLTFWDVLDVYCQTSMAPTVGRPLMPAMAGGVPSIATDVEGLRSLVEPRRDRPGRPPRRLLGAGRLDRRAARRPRPRADARARRPPGRSAANYHPDREADLLDALYREVVDRTGSGLRTRGWRAGSSAPTPPTAEAPAASKTTPSPGSSSGT